MICGPLILLNPAQRLFYSIVGVLMALCGRVISNLGGFLVGTLLGVIGSRLTFGRQPDTGPRHRRRFPRPAPAAAPEEPSVGAGPGGFNAGL